MWKILNDEGILQWFDKINVDEKSLEWLLQIGLKQVPAVLITGNDNKRELHEGLESFKWLDTLIKNRRSNINQIATMNRQKLLENNRQINNMGDNKGLTEYVTGEMTGLSDEYGYLQTDIYQAKNYVDCLKGGQSIVTINEQGKLTKNQTDNSINSANEQREKQTQMLKNEMKQGHEDCIYGNRMLIR
jgi:predicted MPP superfamily phosphohydrolase